MIEQPPADVIKVLVAAALAEDHVTDDVTTLVAVSRSLHGKARFLGKTPGVLAGRKVVEETLRQVEPLLKVSWKVPDGGHFEVGDVLGTAKGPVRGLLQSERVALNFLQRMSGVATLTSRYVEAVAGTRAVILDTRKTTPIIRALEKFAVRCGGGTNHRPDLSAMAMFKDNHLLALERIGATLSTAVESIRAQRPGIAVEIEIDRLEQLEDALTAHPEWILLDNMPVAMMREAVERTKGRSKLEASGGVTLATVRAIAETGVDAISVGALTHSAPALDISLDLDF